MENGQNFEAESGHPESRHSFELSTDCAWRALEFIKDMRRAPENLNRLPISETKSVNSTITEIGCRRCDGGCVVAHKEWKIESSDENFSSCPEFEQWSDEMKVWLSNIDVTDEE